MTPAMPSSKDKNKTAWSHFDRPAKLTSGPHVQPFPAEAAARFRAEAPKRRGPGKSVIFALVMLAHLSVLLVAVLLSIHPSSGYGGDKVIYLMNMEELQMAPPAPAANKAPPPLPDEQRLLVKDENKAAVPEPADTAPAADGQEGTGYGSGGEGNFLPQGKIEVLPGIPVDRLQANMVYPPLALKMGLEALVLLELFIDQNGNIVRIAVLKDPGHGFAEAAVKAFEGISVVPAKANGKAAAVRFRYPVRFSLK